MEPEALESLIIDNPAAGLFRVSRRSYVEPRILELEVPRVFDQCWVYAGHASEVPRPGDYQARRVAGRPVILVRGMDGEVRVLLNTCTHRGAQICRDACGNARTFQCFYHAWTFDTEGRLVGIPGEDAYSAAFDPAKLALGRPPQVETYREFVFVSFNPAVMPLVDYLADAREYLDLIVDQSEGGMEIVTGTQAYSMRANWKLLVENSIDGYHARTTHQRYFEFIVGTGVNPELVRRRRGGVGKALGNGHAVMENEAPWGRPIAKWEPRFGEAKRAELEAVHEALADRFGVERARRMTQTSRNLLIFPNLIVNDIMAITIRTFFPIAHDAMEINAWALAPRGESAENRALRLDNFLTFLGPGGFATPDDVEALESCQRGFAAREVEWSDMSRGMTREQPMVDDELQLRAFWRQWHALVRGWPLAEVPVDHAMTAGR
jgi:phenylpropionate dioxygenase-like ring-hydroxylating dioxygenase large terminal subunit